MCRLHRRLICVMFLLLGGDCNAVLLDVYFQFYVAATLTIIFFCVLIIIENLISITLLLGLVVFIDNSFLFYRNYKYNGICGPEASS